MKLSTGRKARSIKELRQCSFEEIEQIKTGEYYRNHKSSVQFKTATKSTPKPDPNAHDIKLVQADNDAKFDVEDEFEDLRNCQYLRIPNFASSMKRE